MESKSILSAFKESFAQFYSHPKILIPGIALYILVLLLSKISVSVNYFLSRFGFNTSIIVTSWFFFFVCIFFLVSSYIFSGLIGLSKEIKSKSSAFKIFFNYSNKFFLRNFIIIIIIWAISTIIAQASQYISFFIGNALGLPLNTAMILFFLIYFSLLISTVIFFTLSSFYLVVSNLKVKESILKSFSSVKSNYLSILSANILFFIAFQLVSYLQDPFSSLIEYILLIPIISIFFTKFVLSIKK